MTTNDRLQLYHNNFHAVLGELGRHFSWVVLVRYTNPFEAKTVKKKHDTICRIWIAYNGCNQPHRANTSDQHFISFYLFHILTAEPSLLMSTHVKKFSPFKFRRTALKDAFRTCNIYNSCQTAHKNAYKTDVYF